MEEDFSSLFGRFKEEIGKAFNLSIESLVNETIQLDRQAREVAKSFGQGSEFIQTMKVNMADAVRSVVLLGGNFQNIVDMQKNVSNVLGRNVILSSEIYDKLFAANQVTGQNAETIVESFRDAGMGSFKAVEGMQKVVDVSRASGVNAIKVSGMVLDNMDRMNKFTFQGGVEGLSRMAAQAVSLRFNMNETLNIADKLFNPEDAIEMAAAMQRLGATQSGLLDPLRLMDMAQNDPEELQNQIVSLSKQFVNLKKDGSFEILPGARRQLIEIESALGLSRGELSKMALGAADLDKKMREIQFKPDMSEDERKMIANMAEIGKSGRYEISLLSKDEKTGELKQTTKQISELSKEDVEYLKNAAESKTLEQLTKEQLDIDKVLVSQVEAISETLRKGVGASSGADKLLNDYTRNAIEEVGGALRLKTLDTKNIRETLDGVTNEFAEMVKKITSGGGGSIGTMIDSLGKIETNLLKFGDDAVTEFTDNLSKLNKSISESADPIAVGFTKLVTMFNNLEFPNTTTSTATPTVVPTNDFIIKPNDNDKIYTFPEGAIGGTKLPDLNKLLGMTPQPSMNTMGGNISPINSKMTVDLNINVDTKNSNIDPNSLRLVLDTPEVRRTIIDSVTKEMNNLVGNLNPRTNPYSKNPLIT